MNEKLIRLRDNRDETAAAKWQQDTYTKTASVYLTRKGLERYSR